MSRPRLPLALAAALAALAVAAPAASQIDPPAAETLRQAVERDLARKGPVGKGPLTAPKDHGPFLHDIACGQTVSGHLKTDAVQLDDGSFVDFYEFSGQAGQTVTINMTSSAFDTFLFLLDPVPEVVATDDDSGNGSNARIVHTLNQTSSEWSIAANAFEPFTTGPYTLSLQCSGSQPPPPPPPSDGFFSDPAYPDFRFRVEIGDPGNTRAGNREPDCQPETVCVSGAVPGRSEVFVRIIGPRPNGFLWPTLVRFTPSRVVVDIRQVSTDQLNTYVLPAVPPSVDELSGLQDRTGFQP